MKKLLFLVLAAAWTAPAQAYLVQANLSGTGTLGLINGIGFSVNVTYETTTNTVSALSLNIADPVGDPAVSINGPLDISSSSIALIDSPGFDSYEFQINLTNGPLVYATQLPNLLVRTAQLVAVRLISQQNSDPLSSTVLDENLFYAFVPGSGTQPQRMFLDFVGVSPFEYNVPETIGAYSPTSVNIVATPSPAPLALLAGGAVALAAGIRRHSAEA